MLENVILYYEGLCIIYDRGEGERARERDEVYCNSGYIKW